MTGHLSALLVERRSDLFPTFIFMTEEYTSLIHPKRPRYGWFLGRLIAFIERQKPSDRVLLRSLFFICLAFVLTSGVVLSARYTEPTPVSGGTLIEGIVGVPRFVNPVLAVTRVDQDIAALVFAGLMKINPDGELVPDIAESITPSSDGATYNIIIRSDIRFHDGTPLTARDVSFTIALMQDADLKSPVRGNWTGVMVEEIGEYEFNLILSEPYTPFLENLTFGILPRHIWSELPIEQIPFSQRNTDPIGAGPFRVKDITRNSAGLIQTYTLEQAPQYHRDVKISDVRLRFYQNETTLLEALRRQEIMSSVYVPLTNLSEFADSETYQIVHTPLPRVFAIFFNQNRSAALRDQAARQALSAAINREELVATVLSGYGVPTTHPVPPFHSTLQSTSSIASSTEDAASILLAGGWRQNSDGRWEKRLGEDLEILAITLRTTNNPIFEQTAQYVRQTWEALGVAVFIEQYEQSDLLQTVIRPRDFESLLFGLDMNRTVDLYPFWHSSQREDPGLNIAQYANITVDRELVTARTSRDEAVRTTALNQVLFEIQKDSPAIFLYVPSLTYVINKNTELTNFTGLSRPHERFMNIHEWHMANEERWPLFR